MAGYNHPAGQSLAGYTHPAQNSQLANNPFAAMMGGTGGTLGGAQNMAASILRVPPSWPVADDVGSEAWQKKWNVKLRKDPKKAEKESEAKDTPTGRRVQAEYYRIQAKAWRSPLGFQSKWRFDNPLKPIWDAWIAFCWKMTRKMT